MFRPISILPNQYYLGFSMMKQQLVYHSNKNMEYKSSYLTSNVHLNFIVLALHDFLNTPLYEKFGITIHSQ